LRGRLAAVLVGGFVVDDVDGLGDALLARADGDAGGITAVWGAPCPLDEVALAVRCSAVDAHAATRATATRKLIAAATRVARRAVIVVSRGIAHGSAGCDGHAPCKGAQLAEAVTGSVRSARLAQRLSAYPIE
jgi:hypothetical protein